jgi:hypothetical protein
MKNIITVVLFFLFQVSLFGQNPSAEPKVDSTKNFKHELKLNALDILSLPALGITYEHYLNPYSSYGLYGFVNFNSTGSYRDEILEIAPFYRIYFQKEKNQQNRGVFTDFFMGLNYGEVEYYSYSDFGYYYDTLYLQQYLGVALGTSVGYKFVNFNNYSFEISVGAGRYLNKIEVKAYPRLQLSIGKRF